MDAFDALGFAGKLLKGLPVLRGLLGYAGGGPLGAAVGIVVAMLAVVAVIVVAAFVAARRLPVRIVTSPDLMHINQEALTGLARCQTHGASRLVSVWLSAKVTANAYGASGEYRFTALRAEFFHRPFGLFPVRVAGAPNHGPEVQGDADEVDWLLTANAAPETRRALFTPDPDEISGRWKVKPGDRLYARLIAEFGAGHRTVYVTFSERIEVRAVGA